MSTQNDDGSHFENHPAAAEIRDLPAHAFRSADSHGQEDHLTPAEQTRQGAEYSPGQAAPAPTVGHGITAFGRAEIEALAFQYWEERGRPEGHSDEDWFRAVKELRSRAIAR